MSNNVIYKQNEYRIYKPRKTQDGAASSLQLKIVKDNNNLRTVNLFWVAAAQTGTSEQGYASFGWKDQDQQVTMKLDENDIGQILTTLNLMTAETKLYHQNPKGSTTFALTRYDKGFNLRIAKKIDSDLLEIKHTISPGEAEILKILLSRVIITMYQW